MKKPERETGRKGGADKDRELNFMSACSIMLHLWADKCQVCADVCVTRRGTRPRRDPQQELMNGRGQGEEGRAGVK